MNADAPQDQLVAYPLKCNAVRGRNTRFPYVPGTLHLLAAERWISRITSEQDQGFFNAVLDFYRQALEIPRKGFRSGEGQRFWKLWFERNLSPPVVGPMRPYDFRSAMSSSAEANSLTRP